jgi:glycosyltransferase involved in cell wall biosynthesis
VDIITPCYNEEECVELFYGAIATTFSFLERYSFSIIFIDDGSADKTLEKIKNLESVHGSEQIKYISFSRNFGKEAAIFAGLEASAGDLTVLMDADLQDPPELLPVMFDAIENEGYDCCATYRTNRTGEPPVRSWFAEKFYLTINAMSKVKMKAGARDFRVMTRKMTDAVVLLGEYERFSKGLFMWVGFKTKWIDYKNVNRVAGNTKWSFFSLFKYAVSGIVAFSTVPLRIASILGVFVVLGAIGYMLYIFTATIFFGVKTSGFATTIIFMLFLCGTIIVLLGIIGEYIARIYSEIKHRPIYISRESNIKTAKITKDEVRRVG